MMRKTLIIVAGPPATGKTYLISKIRAQLDDFFVISPDEIKELYADKYGFNNLQQKAALEEQVWLFYYAILEKYLWVGKKLIITEYPFSDKQKNKLAQLAEHYHYQVITVRLVADFSVLWQRRHLRDLEPTRHLSHIMTSYHQGDILADRALADNHITEAEFKKRIEHSRYNHFSLGELYEADVTDYQRVNYDALIDTLIKKTCAESI